ncbi:MAG: glucokinase, partial [Pseudomonadales bacterium]|nr:glucokinase [Pseudomonadales bacterium]
MKAGSLLIGDIGGTNARFALARNDVPGFDKALTLPCAEFETAEAAIAEYLKRTGAPQPQVICFAAAGPVVDGSVRFTNNHWTLSAQELAADFKIKSARVRLLNDFEAIAYSIPCLGAEDCVAAGLLPVSKLKDRDFTVGIVGPGTGLGAAGLLRRDGVLVPIVGEGGHVGFAPESQLQMQLLNRLRDQFDRVSDERLVSGPGLENIFAALVSLHGEKAGFASAKEIFKRAAANEGSRANEALQIFYEILGQVAGNLALTLGAADGIYIAGGIVKRDPALLANSRFRSAFESKGRHRSLM